jgi:argininosuccinate lyase
VLGLKLDYRRAHGLVAGLMGGLEEQGRTLSSLTDEELKAACRAAGGDLPPVPDTLLQSALDPWSCLKARDDIGGAAPVEVQRQTHDLADSFARHEQWLEAARHRHATAEENLLAEARALAGRSP